MIEVNGSRDLWSKRIDDHRHDRRHRGDHRREKVDEARRFVGNDVFFEDELDEVGEGLQNAAGTDAIRTKPALNESEHAPFGQHGVGDHQQHDEKGDRDGDELSRAMSIVRSSIELHCSLQ